MKLNSEAKSAHKLWSVQAAAASVLLTLQEIVPVWEGLVPDKTFAVLGAVAATAAIVGRVLKQKGVPPEEDA